MKRSVFAIGWTAWKLDPVACKLTINTGVSTSLAIDADQATGAALRMLRKDWSPSDGWTVSTAITEITADDVRRTRRAAANPEEPTP